MPRTGKRLVMTTIDYRKKPREKSNPRRKVLKEVGDKRTILKQFKVFIIIIILLTATTSAYPVYTEIYWQGTTGNWSISSNWDKGEPGSGEHDHAIIRNGGTAQVTSGNDENCYGLCVGHTSGYSGTINVQGGNLLVDSTLYVSQGGSGKMNISNGGTVASSGAIIASTSSFSSSTGQVTIDGYGSLWSSGWLSIGYGSSSYGGGNGVLSVINGGQLASAGTNIGYYDGSTGKVTISGENSIWQCSDVIKVGYYDGDGTLDIENDGKVVTDTLLLGDNGQVNLTGGFLKFTGSMNFPWDSYGDFAFTSGELKVQGGTITVDHTPFLRSDMRLVVSGINSQWLANGNYNDIALSRGEMEITNGGYVSSRHGFIGYDYASIYHPSTVVVKGAGSTWENSNNLYVGRDGSGILEITSGGIVTVGENLRIDNDGGNDSFINIASGGMLALWDYGWTSGDDLDDFLEIVYGTGPINYWNGSAWVDITGATYGVDYELEHIADGGNMDDYTVLTVLSMGPPEDYDIDEDGDVDFRDFASLASEWFGVGCFGPEWCNRADVDRSGDVGISDIQLLTEHWLEGRVFE